ncbi:hypothetical protein ACI2IX_19435 [Leifsonia aquatica]|uniref:hypothetical protein n=1 Tax=Leifsonia aquatica TaxID=144185 RepID=UPI0038505C71
MAPDILNAVLEGTSLGDAFAGESKVEALGAGYGTVIGGACEIGAGFFASVTAGAGLACAVTCVALAQTVSNAVEAFYDV